MDKRQLKTDIIDNTKSSLGTAVTVFYHSFEAELWVDSVAAVFMRQIGHSPHFTQHSAQF